MFDLKSPEELSFMTLDSDAKFEEKLTLGLENNIYKEFGKFSPEHNCKSQNRDFDGILLSKVENN